MLSIIVLETSRGLGFCLLNGEFFEEFDLFWVLLLFFLFGFFLT